MLNDVRIVPLCPACDWHVLQNVPKPVYRTGINPYIVVTFSEAEIWIDMWYFFLIVAILLVLYTNSKRKNLSRLDEKDVGPFHRSMATEFGVMVAACISMTILLVFLMSSTPSISKIKEKNQQLELQAKAVLAERLAKEISIKVEGQALLIFKASHDRETMTLNERGKQLQSVLSEALEKGFGGKIKLKETRPVFFDPNTSDPEESLFLKNDDLDAIVSNHPECNIIICFINLDNNFVQSETARNPEKILALYSTNPYMLEYPITQGNVITTISPKRQFQPDVIPPTDPEIIFDQRYVIINRDNFYEINKTNKGLLYIHKQSGDPAPAKKDNGNGGEGS